MSELKLKGKITAILDLQKGTSKAGKEWQKQSFVISNNEGYNGKEQIFCFEIFGAEKVETFNKFNKVNDIVNVSFNIQTNEYQGKYYTSLQSWRIDKLENDSVNKQTDLSEDLDTDSDDLPF